MEVFAMCPKCNTPIDLEDTIDTYRNGDEYIEFCTGRCPQCETDYQWEEKYTYSGPQKIEEM